MERFLKSIGLDENEFDLGFDLVNRAPTGEVVMKIVKDTPWSVSQLEKFLNATSTIEYKYRMSFSYRNKPTIYQAIDLFSFWYDRNYLVPTTLQIDQDNDTIVFYAKDNDNSELIVEEFKSFLSFLNYVFKVDFVLLEEEEKIKISSKEMKKVEKAAEKEAEDFIENDDEIQLVQIIYGG